MRRPIATLTTLAAVERDLDERLRELRALDGSTNTLARSNIEWRIGRLRERKRALEQAA